MKKIVLEIDVLYTLSRAFSGLKCDIFTENILRCDVVFKRKEINVQNHNERTDQSVSES